MDQSTIINLAMLLGSDYTPGIHGIGIVNALEVRPPPPRAQYEHDGEGLACRFASHKCAVEAPELVFADSLCDLDGLQELDVLGASEPKFNALAFDSGLSESIFEFDRVS